jgi:hypothetical protein
MILISVDEYERLKAVEESAARLRAVVERIAAMPSDADRWLDDTERPQTVARAALDALPSALVVSPPQPACANCLHPWYAHVNSGHIGECRDVVSDGSRCGCTRFEASAPVVTQEGE